MDAHLAFTRFTGRRLHLGVCGSIAAYKAPDFVRMWRDAGMDVGVTLTDAARRFIAPLTFAALGASPVFTTMFAAGHPGDGASPHSADDDVFGHLMPGQSAHAFVIAPASASTLARLAHGLADDMLSAQALAYPGPLVIAPAMNPKMWSNPATQDNLDVLRRRGHVVVEPGCGRTACMEEGQGRLADPRDIYLHALRAASPQDMQGRRVLVTLGPTREQWDGVRYWTNPSSGVMGASVAVALWLRGADVHAVCGPGTPWLPAAITRHDVTSARQMFEAADGLWDSMDAGVFTAAVADFSPAPRGPEKFKKADAQDGFSVDFTPNPDILATLGQRKRGGQKVVGFAAETSGLAQSMARKLAAKNADMIVGNLVGGADAGFGSATNRVTVLAAGRDAEEWPVLPKPDVAWRIVDWLVRL
ncbi:bifunctional phosphopantothenoylcysteine decarboxylase/phosphopantothenate--cysteine ligase CoaBC [Nitratidesulfovibrio sp. HK-II]|uniref:bifunctional phosphopantothenoylcysteine decarboxylase/phosphopantothenate--cysteine ligase CoaBC n=1 Tax=Nitratidesulfovibrio sp. HK-II TaxID=2009266 RepID=UPI000E2FE2F3|nr:bifunctional phosphopantothenoylcysteine decarboxylase/phosphopantothenate--cysteine ligase CoaBC [Nitratidesulfovibrio sp. HK-II]GBO97460.1 phosphopantothenoylcysteine decarboxylase [Nitratidesulfovibrio sp. HK-II]